MSRWSASASVGCNGVLGRTFVPSVVELAARGAEAPVQQDLRVAHREMFARLDRLLERLLRKPLALAIVRREKRLGEDAARLLPEPHRAPGEVRIPHLPLFALLDEVLDAVARQFEHQPVGLLPRRHDAGLEHERAGAAGPHGQRDRDHLLVDDRGGDHRAAGVGRDRHRASARVVVRADRVRNIPRSLPE